MVVYSLVNSSLNDNTHMAYNSIILCPITSLNIDYLFYDILQDMPYCFPCAVVGVACACV